MTATTALSRTVDQFLSIMLPGLLAVRRNWAPILLIQMAAALLVVSYYHFLVIREFAVSISDEKLKWGELFVIVSGGFAGGILPQIAQIFTRHSRRFNREYVTETLYTAFVFAVIAVQVDAFYKLQALVFGHGVDVLTLIKKTFVDMFIVSPTVFVPTGMFLLYARQKSFQKRSLTDAFSWSFYRSYVVPTMPMNWAFWIPVVLCIYALPSTLQFPFAQLAEAAWSLIFVVIAAEAHQS